MLRVQNITPYTGKNTKEHDQAVKLLGVTMDGMRCLKASAENGRIKVLIFVRHLVDQNQSHMEILYWTSTESILKRSSLFLDESRNSGKIN